MSATNVKTANPVVDNPVASALDALKSGKDVESAVYGSSSAPKAGAGSIDATEVDESGFSVDSFMSGDEAPIQQDNSIEGGVSEESTLDEKVPNSQAKPAGDIEEIIITDDSGKKKLKVDWSDREKLKKYVQQAAGMRKFQAERDQLTTKLKTIEPEYQDLKKSWSAVEEAFSKGGIKGLVNLLAGDAQGYEKHIQSEVARIKAREAASPSELERMDLEEKLTLERRERELLQKKVEEDLRRSQEEREVASLKSLESQVHPAFDKYRFAGKLGDEVVEARLDQAVWDQALKRLEQYPDDVELTSTLIDREFREVANSFRKIINKQAEQKANKVVTSKKIAAQENAAAAAMNSMMANTAQSTEKFKQDIRKGDLTSALRDMMTGKFKF
jgi:hypothetical protein